METDKYTVIDKLDTGAFGDILLVERDSVRYAIKALKLIYLDFPRRTVDSEVRALFQLQHKNIVNLIEVLECKRTSVVWMVFELAENGNLEQHLFKSGSLSDDDLKNYIIQLSHAVDYTHSYNYAHRDITPRNILLFSQGALKLGDFGCCVLCGDSPECLDLIGDPRYLAPEVLQRSKHHPMLADLWSLGCCVFFMFTAKHLQNGTEEDIRRCQRKGKILYVNETCYQEKYSPLKRLIAKLLSYDPSTRPKVTQWRPDDIFQWLK